MTWGRWESYRFIERDGSGFWGHSKAISETYRASRYGHMLFRVADINSAVDKIEGVRRQGCEWPIRSTLGAIIFTNGIDPRE